jgi:hypothetical protein
MRILGFRFGPLTFFMSVQSLVDREANVLRRGSFFLLQSQDGRGRKKKAAKKLNFIVLVILKLTLSLSPSYFITPI